MVCGVGDMGGGNINTSPSIGRPFKAKMEKKHKRENVRWAGGIMDGGVVQNEVLIFFCWEFSRCLSKWSNLKFSKVDGLHVCC